MNSNVNRTIEQDWGMPVQQDMAPIQEAYDNQMISALARGVLKSMNTETGSMETAERYYAPSRDDSANRRLGAWITQADAQAETGLKPSAPENIIFIHANNEVPAAA